MLGVATTRTPPAVPAGWRAGRSGWRGRSCSSAGSKESRLPGRSSLARSTHPKGRPLERKAKPSGAVERGADVCRFGDQLAPHLVGTDFNIQLADWLTRSNLRIHRTLQARPADLLEADRSWMPALPPIAPPGTR